MLGSLAILIGFWSHAALVDAILSALGFVDLPTRARFITAFVGLATAFLLFSTAVIGATRARPPYLKLDPVGALVAASSFACWSLASLSLVVWVKLRDSPANFAVALAAGYIGIELASKGSRAFALARQHMARTADELRRPTRVHRSFTCVPSRAMTIRPPKTSHSRDGRLVS